MTFSVKFHPKKMLINRTKRAGDGRAVNADTLKGLNTASINAQKKVKSWLRFCKKKLADSQKQSWVNC